MRTFKRLHLNTEVCEESINPIIEEIYNHLDRNGNSIEIDDIMIHINTVGGCLYSTIRLIQLMDLINSSDEIRFKIHANIDGIAYSAGFLIWINGYSRSYFPMSSAMWHDVSYGDGGFSKSIEEGLDHITKIMGMINDNIRKNTKLTKRQLDKMRNEKNNWYWYGEELDDILKDGYRKFE